MQSAIENTSENPWMVTGIRKRSGILSSTIQKVERPVPSLTIFIQALLDTPILSLTIPSVTDALPTTTFRVALPALMSTVFISNNAGLRSGLSLSGSLITKHYKERPTKQRYIVTSSTSLLYFSPQICLRKG